MSVLSRHRPRRATRISGSTPHGRLSVLAIALRSITMGAAVVSVAVSTQVFAQAAGESVQRYDIAPGSLSNVLGQFAAESAVLLSADGQLTRDKSSAGLRGSYSVQAGLAALLQGSGLSAQRLPTGAYVVQRTAVESRADAPTATTAGPVAIGALASVTVVGDWLGQAVAEDVFEHPGARDVVRREQFTEQGAVTVREALNRVPGVMAPENNGTGGQDLALNFGIRGLNPRLASRSTVLMDGIPVPFAPYGQPQLSLAPISLGNMDAIDVVRGGGAVRYGPQNVGGVVNFVTRAIPQDYLTQASLQTEYSPTSSSNQAKTSGNAIIGGTNAQGLGGAVLYSGVRGSDWREHSDTSIDDLILKGSYQLSPEHKFGAIMQYYEGEAEMPGGLSSADYARDPFQSTRPYDKFWGRRTMLSANYAYKPDQTREFTAMTFYTRTLRSGFLDQGTNLTLSPREYWVRGAELHYSQILQTGPLRHELGLGWRVIEEDGHELRYNSRAGTRTLPSTSSPFDRDTRGSTSANAVYLDDRIDVGNWTFTPGVRYEMIRAHQDNILTSRRDGGNYNTPLPALNVLYHVNPRWNLYANTEGSFGAVQYSQMGKAVSSGSVEPEKARTWELGTRYDNGDLQAEVGAFLINFDNQYESNQTTDSVTARGKTRHQGLEGSAAYQLGALDPRLKGVSAYINYAYVDASIREAGANYSNQVPFSSRHKAVVGLAYKTGPWRANLNAQAQSGQFADNANTRPENAAGNVGFIPGFMVYGINGGYKFGPSVTDPAITVGIKNLLDKRYYTRSFDDNNRGKYVAQPRTFYVQVSAGF